MILNKRQAEQQLRDFRQKIQQASGQMQKDIQIVAVSKTHPAPCILPFFECGHIHFGENRFAEARDKFATGPLQQGISDKKISLHYLGPVQSGNARQIPRLFQYIHSIGSWQELAIIEKTVEKLNKQQEEATGGKQVEKKLPIGYFLQLRLSKEKTKVTGFKPEQLEQASHFPTNDWVSFQGFMTMGTFNDRNQTEEIFHQAKEIRDHLAPSAKLSMGMSDDWDLAIRYDTDWLRIGSYFFGPRQEKN